MDALWSWRWEQNPYQYGSNNPLTRIDASGLYDIEVQFVRGLTETEPRYGVAVVTDNGGNTVFSFVVRGDGIAGANRLLENADTPTGTYDITGWITPTVGDRPAYGQYPRLALVSESGEVLESNRTLIRIHGGRQEHQDENGEWVRDDDPQLINTHGCLRAFDEDMRMLKEITDKLKAADRTETDGILIIKNSITKQGEPKLVEENRD